ncbi:MAG: DUF3179 domain-containing protein [Parcubacteria group bacterium]|nr:DUF3179 domain-containing protein [Parcubacteria group bacterium]
MTGQQFKIGFILFLTLSAGIIYYQYQFYRSPVLELNDSNAELSQGRGGAPDVILETDGALHVIPLEDIVTGNPVKDGIPSIDEPKYESVRAADQYLDNYGFGLAVEVGGLYRFYPYQILVWHEIVNDTFGGEDLLVTYCPLCFTGIVFEREVAGETVEFGTSGKLYDSNLLMYDRKTETLWSQAMGKAVVGELTGASLTSYLSLTISWADFRNQFPSGQVLSRNTGYTRDYTSDPYGPSGYYENASIMFPISHEDGRAHPKLVIYGYKADGASKAYGLDAIKDVGLVNDVVGGDALLVVWDSTLNAVKGFSRQLDADVLEFKHTAGFFTDIATGSLWNDTGEAVSGEYRGRQLEVVSLENSFWFSWATTYPETDLLTKE